MRSECITFKFPIPSKKNCKQIRKVRGKSFIASSAEFVNWEGREFERLRGAIAPFEGPVRIEYTAYPPDAKVHDWDNAISGIQDLLVKRLKILKDDNWFVLRDIDPYLVEVDQSNPRIEVEIFEIEDIETWIQYKQECRRLWRSFHLL